MLKQLFTTAALCLGTLAMAQDAYPSKPITLIVPNPPGGFVDASGPLVSEPLARLANRPVGPGTGRTC